MGPRNVLAWLYVYVLAHAACLHEPHGDEALRGREEHRRASPDHLCDAREDCVLQVVHPPGIAGQAGDAQLLAE